MENGTQKIALRAAAGFLIAITIIIAVLASGITLPSLESKKGRVTVLLIDAPIPVDQLNVTLMELEIHKVGDGESDGEWISLLKEEDGITFNLLYYQDGRTLALASAELGIGSYNKIRMNVTEAYIPNLENPDEPIPLNVPPGKIDVIVKFELEEGDSVIVTIDMEPDWIAISESGNLRPTLKASTTETIVPPNGED